MENSKSKEKEIKRKRRKKIIVAEISFAIVVAGIIIGFITYANFPKGGTLIAGFFSLYSPEYIDPLQGYDSSVSDDLIDQVAEGLLDYDLNSPNLKIIPNFFLIDS